MNPSVPHSSLLTDSLAKLVQAEGLDTTNLRPAIPASDGKAIDISNRSQVGISDGKQVTIWYVPSLRALFRGDRKPPNMKTPPDEYALFMYVIENQVLMIAGAQKHPAYDDDILEAFSAIRRRPDGRSLGKVHDALWQAAALSLGFRPTSADEFEAIMRRLERSVRHWRRFNGSTGYSEFLRDHLHGDLR